MEDARSENLASPIETEPFNLNSLVPLQSFLAQIAPLVFEYGVLVDWKQNDERPERFLNHKCSGRENSSTATITQRKFDYPNRNHDVDRYSVGSGRRPLLVERMFAPPGHYHSYGSIHAL